MEFNAPSSLTSSLFTVVKPAIARLQLLSSLCRQKRGFLRLSADVDRVLRCFSQDRFCLVFGRTENPMNLQFEPR